jgi:hypothetical protein
MSLRSFCQREVMASGHRQPVNETRHVADDLALGDLIIKDRRGEV